MLHARKDYTRRIQDSENKIPKKEPVFLLRAQDKTAIACVELWIVMNMMLADRDDEAIRLAKNHVKKMKRWPVKKTADVE